MREPEAIFEGPAMDLPAGMAMGSARYLSASGATPVRHLRGYLEFLDFCDRKGVAATELAADLEAFFAFLRRHGTEILGSPTLKPAAGIFAGNMLVSLRSDAEWASFGEDLPEAGNQRMRVQPLAMLEGLHEADEEMLQEFVSRLRSWASEADEPQDEWPQTAPPHLPSPADLPQYIRPALAEKAFYSEDSEAGEPIRYGHRWGTDGPPSDSYSVVSYPERFAGLHVVADALIDYLATVYDVDVDPDVDHAGDLLRQTNIPLRVARLTPKNPDAAPLTFVFTDFPGIAVHAGALHDFIYPPCGCDACDETTEGCAEELEWQVLAIAAGGYSEWVGRNGEGGMTLRSHDRSASSSSGDLGQVSTERLESARVRLQQLPDGWLPWPRRATELPGGLSCQAG